MSAIPRCPCGAHIEEGLRRRRRMNKVLRWSCALAIPVTILLALLGGVCR